MRTIVALAVVGCVAACASAQYSVTGFAPSLWQASDATIGVAGYTIEDFEDVALVDGLQISVAALDGSYGPTSTLPNEFNPVTDDPHGNVFDTGPWDGTGALLNTFDNRTSVYSFQDHWNSIMTLHFADGAKSIGFSLQQMQINAVLVVDGNELGVFHTLAGLGLSSGRNGYIRIDGCNTTIFEVEIRSQNADGWVIDHLAFEPADGFVCIADFNDDCGLNFFDVQAFLAAFAGGEPDADTNGDGAWNFFDVQRFLSLFAAGCD